MLCHKNMKEAILPLLGILFLKRRVEGTSVRGITNNMNFRIFFFRLLRSRSFLSRRHVLKVVDVLAKRINIVLQRSQGKKY